MYTPYITTLANKMIFNAKLSNPKVQNGIEISEATGIWIICAQSGDQNSFQSDPETGFQSNAKVGDVVSKVVD